MSQVLLTALDVQGPTRWFWRLTADGAFLEDFQVDLDASCWQYEAYLDLHGYLRRHAAPDRRRQDERRMIREVGQWMGQHVLGPIGPRLVQAVRDANQPVTVHVTVEPSGEADAEDATGSGAADSLDHQILFRPLELAYVGDRPISLQDVSLVFDVPARQAPAGWRPPEPDRPPGPLRILAVFSLPLNVSALNLRHERYQLRKMLQTLVADRGYDLEFRVLQYGVTRAALGKLLAEGPGWDVLHFSGHGLASQLILEREDGTHDPVTSAELVDLLRPARGRLRWVTLSSCLSAAATVDETLRWLGLGPERQRDLGATAELESEAAQEPAAGSAPRMPALAWTLAQELDCAVLAMRFPVGDEFAIDLGQAVYRGVLEQRQTLDRAIQRALPELIERSSAAAAVYPPLSQVTPALFGRRADGLAFAPPRREELFELPKTGMAHFPPPEERLVGRVGVLSQASRRVA